MYQKLLDTAREVARGPAPACLAAAEDAPKEGRRRTRRTRARARATQAAKPDALSQIELDLHRTFPDHPRFNHKKAKARRDERRAPRGGAGQRRG